MTEHTPLRLPDLGLGAAGLGDLPLSLAAWYADVGDRVNEGEALVEILAGDATLDLPSPASGYVVERRVRIGEPLAVGQVLAIIASGTAPRRTSPTAGPGRSPAA